MTAYDAQGVDITDRLFAPSGFLKVDADYTPKPYDEWRAEDWPSTYQSPAYGNIFGVGIAFAPPHPISRPRTSPNGTVIARPRRGPACPRASWAARWLAAMRDMIQNGATAPTHTASMSDMGAACVASAGTGFRHGSAAAMTMYPVVPDYQKYPHGGRSLTDTSGEIGLAGHWIKHLLHFLFLYKAKARPGWFLIPE